MRKLRISIIFSFVFCCMLTMLGFAQECDNVRNDVFRLHILANSDSQRDQKLKLQVRDRILELSEDVFANAQTKDEAIKAASDNLEKFRKCAIDELRANGCEDDVEIEIGQSRFNTRRYGNVTLPAGTYPAMRVLIGEANGHNWWCVMFPQLCLPAAQSDPRELFSEDEARLVMSGEKYELRFKCVEYYERLKELLNQ